MIRAAWRRAVSATATALSWIVLGALYWPLFVPARLLLALQRRDPLRRAFPAPEASCWEPHRAPTDAHRRQS